MLFCERTARALPQNRLTNAWPFHGNAWQRAEDRLNPKALDHRDVWICRGAIGQLGAQKAVHASKEILNVLLHQTSDSHSAFCIPAGELTLREVQSVVDVRSFTRLKDVLDGLSTIGLLKPSLVLTDSSGQSGGLKEAQWAAETHAILEEPAESAESHALKHLWDGVHTPMPGNMRPHLALDNFDGMRHTTLRGFSLKQNVRKTPGLHNTCIGCLPREISD